MLGFLHVDTTIASLLMGTEFIEKKTQRDLIKINREILRIDKGSQHDTPKLPTSLCLIDVPGLHKCFHFIPCFHVNSCKGHKRPC